MVVLREICWRNARLRVNWRLKCIVHVLRNVRQSLNQHMAKMNRRNVSSVLVVIFLGVPVWNVTANGFGVTSQDAFATARGEAFVATANNASAIYYNPAGITQLKGNNLRGGLYGIYLDPSYTAPLGRYDSGKTYNIGKHYNFIPQLFLTHSFEKVPVSVGLGVYAPFGGSMDWPNHASFNTVATRGKLTYLTVDPVMAVRLSPNLAIGGGVMVNYVNMDLEQVVSYPTRDPNFFRFKGDGLSVGYNLGALWQPIDQISIGATLRSSAMVNLKGHTQFQYPPNTPYTSFPAQVDFTFPLTAVVGISYRPTFKWNLEFDANYTDWGSFGTTTIYQQGSAFGFPRTIPVNLYWQPSWVYEFGVTRYFDTGWHVSAGYAYNENSVPDAYYTPLAADLGRHFFSVGVGYAGKRFNFDVAYQFGYGPARTVTGSTPPIVFSNFGSPISHPADGKYEFTSHAVLVTVGVHF